MAKTSRKKPTKPYPSFPLTAHANGQWCKKILSKVHFFGIWADPTAALQRYHASAADLHAGRTTRPTLSRDEPTVKDVCNSYLGWQKGKLDADEIGARWFEDCREIVSEFATAVGKGRVVADLRPDDFQRYRVKLAKRLGVHALTRHLTSIRSMFKYAYDVELIDDLVRLGKGFANPSATHKRKAKQKAELEHGKRLFVREELVSILEACGPELRGPVLLGINGGFGNTDCATLPRAAVDFDAGVIAYARPKTGVRRVVPLWPQTSEALRRALGADRPKSADDAAADLVFLAPNGRPLVRQIVSYDEARERTTAGHTDELSVRFAALLKSLGIHRSGLGFYTLRHTFRTWADETNDQHAIHLVMGHAIPGMSGIYVEEIGVERLRKVVNHVRSKLWPEGTGQQAPLAGTEPASTDEIDPRA
jgi:integrase